MKRAVFILIVLLFLNIFTTSLIRAQDENNLPGLPVSEEQINKAGEFVNDAPTKWEYLQKEWKNILLNNKFVNIMNSFFTKISVVFKILFGMDWEFPSFLLFMIIILWFFFFFEFSYILNSFSTFSTKISYIISFLFVIILAQTKVLDKISTFIINLLSSPKIGFEWLRTILFFIIIIILFLIAKLTESYSKETKEERKKREKEIDDIKFHGTVKAAEEIGKSLKD